MIGLKLKNKKCKKNSLTAKAAIIEIQTKSRELFYFTSNECRTWKFFGYMFCF